jgi:antitoxin ParD1/3/4
MTVRKSISFTNQHDEWIKTQIASGQYGSESEVIRDLIRKEQTQHAELERIRAALIAGEESGISSRTPEDIRQRVQDRLRQNGQLRSE